MNNPSPINVVVCNGAHYTTPLDREAPSPLHLDYRTIGGSVPNIKVLLPKFVQGVYHLPDRILDLLEIAAYVYCADRYVQRGTKSDLEYHAWARSFQLIIRVRDIAFWSQPHVGGLLNELLSFLSGNKQFAFSFQGGHSTPPTSLFDTSEFHITSPQSADVLLFSGGVDSLAGAVERLATTDGPLCLVSHRSGQPETSRTQDQLIRALDREYPHRIQHFKFQCSLQGERAHEETQRTRFFLYSAIAFALASILGRDTFFVYENGITSLNFPKRQDLMNGRASRTTHPRSIFLLQRFFSELNGSDFRIQTPFFWKTKTDVLETLRNGGRANFLDSSVSCSKVFKAHRPSTQCGGCSQCVDRRMATFAARMEEYDNSILYGTDFIHEAVNDGEVVTALKDFLRQAAEFSEGDVGRFYTARANELAEVIDYLPFQSEAEAVERIWQLCHRHGTQIKDALQWAVSRYGNPFAVPPSGSLLQILNAQDYTKESPTMAEPPKPNLPIEVFFSYSHKDERLRNDLVNHLSTLLRQGVITDWHDRKITAGNELDGQIDAHLNSAAVILLLVSSDFLASRYCSDIELKRAMERHEAGEARVIPVILRECDWHDAEFGKLVALPTDGQAIRSKRWHSKDEAFTDVVKGVRRAVEEMYPNRK